jgi:hypothetical protein
MMPIARTKVISIFLSTHQEYLSPLRVRQIREDWQETQMGTAMVSGE